MAPAPETTATKLVERADGRQELLLRQARLAVKRGPDKGQELVIDRPRVRVGTAEDCDLTLSDSGVSRYHFEIQATERGYLIRDLQSTNGTRTSDELSIIEAVATRPTTIRVGQRTLLHLQPTAREVAIPLSSRHVFGELSGQSWQMRRVFAVFERVAPAGATVLLEGESGTGKELAAAAIHAASPRAEGPFIIVDCGAIPATLIESELFGHEKGAFTGATEARAGALEQADGGTVFLDEIGELPLELQPRLLRFLEGGKIKRVGAAQYRKVDARVVAATNRRLTTEVAQGRFREDLYYRLSVVRVEMPTLRERPGDILPLAHQFAAAFGHDPEAVIDQEIAALLLTHAWPGNVRELRNVVERLTVMPEATAAQLRGELPTPRQEPAIGPLADLPFHEARRRWQDAFERQYLKLHLERTGGVVTRSAEAAGLPRQTFNRMLRRHGIAKPT